MTTAKNHPRVDALASFVAQVLEGKAVFFIGAGFSRESEGNTADILILRLMVRFEAICVMGKPEFDQLSRQIASLFKLKPVGSLISARQKAAKAQKIHTQSDIKALEIGKKADGYAKGSPNEIAFIKSLLHPDNIWALADSYFEINDYMCAAYGEMLSRKDIWEDMDLTLLKNLEQSLLGLYVDVFQQGRKESLSPIEKYLWELDLTRAERGKALFLDTMGFRNKEVMGGDPNAPSYQTVRKSYRDKLYPRYHVLARLAREGLAPMLLTTNYDLLLEGGYRLAGFYNKRDDKHAGAHQMERPFRVIASPEGFFRQGSGHNTALIVKIHGCALVYRKKVAEVEAQAENDPLSNYLPSMVFTFREIQNWREDAWSRDMLTTLLRTRTLFFSGYSGQDPVIHDTLRTIYEELSRHRTTRRKMDEEDLAEDQDRLPTPCFYMGGSETPNFHTLEILRAAKGAVGRDSRLNDLENYIQVDFRRTEVPSLDEYYLCIFHLVFRKLQHKALNDELRLLVARLMGPRSERVLKNLIDSFGTHIQKERKQLFHCLNGKGPTIARRRKLKQIVSWSWYFASGLMRQWSMFELAQRQGLHNYQRQAAMDPDHFYRPVAERPDWAAWCAIIELALHNLLGDDLYPVEASLPTVSFANPKNKRPEERHWLTLCDQGLAGAPKLSARGCAQKNHYWHLSRNALPWPAQKPGNGDLGSKKMSRPEPQLLLQWALGEITSEEVNNWFSPSTI